jgi:hypothetical protein
MAYHALNPVKIVQIAFVAKESVMLVRSN